MGRYILGVAFVLILSSLVLPQQVWGVDCLTESLDTVLRTQTEVDSFQVTYGGGSVCDTVTGNLTVYDVGITDLNGLSDLIRVDGNFRLLSTSATTIDDLDGLTSVGRSLLIDYNDALTSIAGLTNLTNVGQSVRVADNDKITNLNGLANITHANQVLIYNNSSLIDIGGLLNITKLEGTLHFIGNDKLPNLNGLANLTNVGGEMAITDNATLTSIDGLTKLTTIGGDLYIRSNSALTDIDGLTNLTSVGSILQIYGNPALTNIDGLGNLMNVEWININENATLTNVDGLVNIHGLAKNLFLYDNPALTNISGLANIMSVGGGVIIRDNPTLWDCSATAPLLGWPDGPPNDNVTFEILVNDNASGCNSIQEILDSYSDGFQINAGLNDAWFNPETSGQGFFISVFPDLALASLAWFTYDTELPPDDAQANLGDPGHRWLTATGPVEGNQVLMNIEMTSGGLFDTPTDIQRTDPPGSDGTIILTFTSCNSGTVEYDIPSINRQGNVPIQRVASDNIELCELLSTN